MPFYIFLHLIKKELFMIHTIGMVGLGLMGSAMSTNLLDAGYSVIGYDILTEQIEALKRKNGTGAASCREIAEASDLVITSLPSAESFREVISGKEGLLSSRKKGLISVETSTLPLEIKQQGQRALEASDMILLDCPLSGTAAQAIKKDLSVYGSGDRLAYDECIPVFESFARTHFYLGEFGMGTKMKLVANLLVAIHNVSAAEGFVLGMKAGLDPEMIYQVISDGAGSSRMFEVRGPLMVSEKYDEVTMKVDVFQKDIEIITSFAKELNVPIPLLSRAAKIYTMALDKGHAKQDTASVCAVLEEMAGLKRN
jgi:3-hydroxyisobutyrate dehydrogenase-like beta-hydroxyacid dehydrogenase